MQNYKDIRAKLDSAQVLFSESTTTLGKLRALSSLLQGINPKVDRYLKECTKHLSTLGKLEDGAIIELSAERIPENTLEEKRRKKVLLLFIKSWKSLQSEIARVQTAADSRGEGNVFQASLWAKILAGAAGPLGVITILAVGAVALQSTAVAITIVNEGCSNLEAASSLPSLPGFSLPRGPIPSGESAEATLPPLSFTVDGTTTGTLAFDSLGLDLSIKLSSSIENVMFNGESLLGRTSTIKLSEAKEHTLLIVCG